MTLAHNIAPPLSVAAGTYPENIAAANHLYTALAYEARHVGEPVKFRGALGLDVGGYNGLYRSVIAGLGLRRVVTVEPNLDTLEYSTRVLPPADAFADTLENWLAAGGAQADSTFVFNIMPRLTYGPRFAEALGAATVPGGIVAVTFREFGTALQFRRTAEGAGLRLLHDANDHRPGAPLPGQVCNCVVHLYRNKSITV